MSKYPHLDFSMNDVRRAGERLKENLAFEDRNLEGNAEIRLTFKIANSYRDSHVYPMRSVRLSIEHRMRTMGAGGLTAARPKRMSSIRRKLRVGTLKLDQMNDLAGCRAIMDDIQGVRAVLDAVHERFPHKIRREYAYIDQPKLDGYRSHHIIFDFCGIGRAAPFDGRRVELQVRTRLQHAWATAVEAVSLYRGEDLKHGKGDDDWLRLFQLSSAEFAYAEGCPVNPAMPDHEARVQELKELDRRIGASNILDDIKNATHYAENFVYERGRYYLIRYMKDHTVVVEPYYSAVSGSRDLGRFESEIELGDDESKVVFVEVDKVDKLVDAYPNYFGDVSLFVRNLRQICHGRNAVEYSMAPQRVARPRPQEKPDLDALKRRYTRWG
ncbi:RelA/SpoT domain-containing protein [Rhizobium lentis]|uniref:RelA/SpoT domain-containing protein n=1 Tax=Rhizobium lentis TaxID=1138194 RepID=UPI001C832581|nr:RelA/SpoT domain-containing protein [Rhizobium lentis]MBX5112665.1 RelA/SpoT domain-containing protein [Rhizobium lentis]